MDPRDPRDLTIRLPSTEHERPRVRLASTWVELDVPASGSTTLAHLAVEAGRALAHLRLASILTR